MGKTELLLVNSVNTLIGARTLSVWLVLVIASHVV